MAYPKSLTELDDPELTEALENMIELLSQMTGVDVETLRKETAHVDEQVDHDPETGEITEPEQTKSGSIPEEPVPADDQPLPVSAASDDVPPTPSSDAPNSEREILIRYARDVLPMAADTSVPLTTVKEIEKQWGIDEISKLSEDGKAKAHAISKSMRSISNNPKLLEGALNHYAEVLECTVEEIGGTNG